MGETEGFSSFPSPAHDSFLGKTQKRIRSGRRHPRTRWRHHCTAGPPSPTLTSTLPFSLLRDPEHGSASSQRSWGRYPIRTPHLRSTTVFPSVCTPVVRWQSQLSGIIWHFRLRKFFSHLLFVSPQTHKINEKTPVNCCEIRVREDWRFAQDTGAELRSPWFWIPCPSPSQHCSHFGMVEPSTDTIPPVGDARAHTTGRWELLGVYQVAFSERGWRLPEGKGGSHQQMTFPFCSELTLAVWWSRVLWCNWGRIFRP